MAGLKGKLLKDEAGEGNGAERDVMGRIIPLDSTAISTICKGQQRSSILRTIQPVFQLPSGDKDTDS